MHSGPLCQSDTDANSSGAGARRRGESGAERCATERVSLTFTFQEPSRSPSPRLAGGPRTCAYLSTSTSISLMFSVVPRYHKVPQSRP